MIALSDHALRLVGEAAAKLPPHQRSEFLHALAARLGERPTANAVEAAIAVVLGGIQAIDGTR